MHLVEEGNNQTITPMDSNTRAGVGTSQKGSRTLSSGKDHPGGVRRANTT